MNKTVLTSFTILCLLSTVFLAGFKILVKGSSDLPVQNIDTHLGYMSIQEAINAPETSDGHTILVDAGIYYEHVVVNKTVSLIGENRSTTIIDGSGPVTVVNLSAENASISDFTIRNGHTGIYIGGLGCTVSGNFITNNSMFGVYSLLGSYSRIWNNIFLLNPLGIWMHACCNTILGNTELYSFKLHLMDRDSTIVGNTFSSDIFVAGNRSRFVYNNFFMEELEFTEAYTVVNTWDDGHYGNYWSSYNGTDTDKNGIGDSHYVVNENNTDRYPLMFPATLFYPPTLFDQVYPLLLNELLSKYGDLNIAYEDLNEEYWELQEDYTYLNESYQRLLVNYEELVEDFDDLNATSANLLSNFDSLNVTYDELNASYLSLNFTYSELQSDYESLSSTYESLNSSYAELQQDYDFLSSSYNSLDTRYNQILTLTGISIAGIIILIAITVYVAIRQPKIKP